MGLRSMTNLGPSIIVAARDTMRPPTRGAPTAAARLTQRTKLTPIAAGTKILPARAAQAEAGPWGAPRRRGSPPSREGGSLPY